jgi:hypothetical protein
MMTEPSEANQDVWREIGTPTDLWSVGKALWPRSPEEELEAWTRTVDTLDALCTMADALRLEPLLLALVDAKARAEEEMERAQDRAERQAKPGVQVTEREDERLLALMHRADALGNACVAVEDWAGTDHDYRERYLPVLTEMREEANHNFEVYRREVGLPE